MKGLSTAENIPAGQLVAERNGHSTSSSVGVISKVLRILEVLQTSSVGLGLKAICDETGINKSTALSDLWRSTQETVNLGGARPGNRPLCRCHGKPA